MNTWIRLVIAVVVLAVIFAALFGYSFHQGRQQQAMMSQPPPPMQVEATTVSQQSWRSGMRAIGSLRAVNGVHVANEVAGVVDRLEFDSGQRVEAGQVLLRLDTATDQAALETREAEERLAQQQFERFSDLIEQRAVSQSDFDEAQANFEAAQARVNEQRALLDKKVITAPFAGVLGLRQVDQGEFLAVGTPIVEINMLDPIYVDFTIAERDLSRITVGDRVSVDVAAFPEDVFQGQVSALDSSISPQSRTVQVRASLNNPEVRLQPGMFASVESFRSEIQEVLTLPRTAISYNTYGDFVYVIVEGERGQQVDRRAVSTGDVRDGRVQLLSGVEAGDVVVATGLSRLRNGQPVQIVERNGTDSSSTASADGSR